VKRPRHLDLWLGIGLAIAFGALYLATFCREVYWYDSAEFVSVAVIDGIPHPPGYPLYTLIAHLFTYLPVSPAVAVNGMSAVFGAVSVGLAFGTGRALGLNRPSAAFAAALLGAGSVFWSNTVVAEVYTTALAFFFCVLWLLVRAVRERRPWLAVVASALAGVTMGVHMSMATTGLGLGLLALASPGGLNLDGGHLRDLKRLVSRDNLRSNLLWAAACLGAAAAGAALVFGWMLIRASMHPRLNFSDPETLHGLLKMVTGGGYGHFFGETAVGPRVLDIGATLGEQLGWVGLGLAVVGAVLGMRRRPLVVLVLLLAAAGNIAFFFDYLVHDFEVFFLPTTAMLCLLAGIGAHELSKALRPNRTWTLAVVLFALPLANAVGSYKLNDLSDFTGARDYGEALVRELPKGAVIVHFTTPPEWARYAVFHDYFQIIKGKRPDVTVFAWPPAPLLGRMVESGRPVYVFYPVTLLSSGTFRLEPEGHLLRVRPGLPPAGATHVSGSSGGR